MTLMLAQGKPCFSSEALDLVRARFSAASPVSPYLSGTAGTPSHCRRIWCNGGRLARLCPSRDVSNHGAA